MIKITGKYNEALCFTPEMEEKAAQQIKDFCDMESFAGSIIRVMPDVHAGKCCTIGTTMTIIDKAIPNMVGVDIGCGMETVQLAEKEIDFRKLDSIAIRDIPSGYNVRKEAHPIASQIDLEALRCQEHVDMDRARKSIGTLGSGNHFIEVDKDEDDNLYLVVHSGSRHLGTQVAEYYQKAGYEAMDDETIPKDLAYVEGQLFQDYIHDMKIVQEFAVLNRKAMVDEIIEKLDLTICDQFTTIHNYIDTESMILRKGSVSAREGEKILIPINMRDGSLICIGKGNADWNFSAPHGAGRLLSRTEAKKRLSMEEYKKEMAGIYSTSVKMSTLDESPMAYKDMSEIVREIEPTAEIIKKIKPVYNYKA